MQDIVIRRPGCYCRHGGGAGQDQPVNNDMQRAIQWEKQKEAAAARQARLEARHPSVTYNNNADRSADRSAPDPGEPAVRQEKKDK